MRRTIVATAFIVVPFSNVANSRGVDLLQGAKAPFQPMVQHARAALARLGG